MAADETNPSLDAGQSPATQQQQQQQQQQQANGGLDSAVDAGGSSSGPKPKVLLRSEVAWDVPMTFSLPIKLEPDPIDPAHQPFPFLDTTLADLGIDESEVKERVVWVDNKKTQVKNKTGKLKEKEVTILEVRVKAQKPGEKQLQEILYSTEAHTDRSFCRSGVEILPWMTRYPRVEGVEPGENGLAPVEMTLPLGLDQTKINNTQEQREI